MFEPKTQTTAATKELLAERLPEPPLEDVLNSEWWREGALVDVQLPGYVGPAYVWETRQGARLVLPGVGQCMLVGEVSASAIALLDPPFMDAEDNDANIIPEEPVNGADEPSPTDAPPAEEEPSK